MIQPKFILSAALCAGLACFAPTMSQAQSSEQIVNGSTTIALDPNLYAALTASGITVTADTPATLTVANDELSLTLPITGGGIDFTTALGAVYHSGGLTFSTATTASDTTGATVTVSALGIVNSGGSAATVYGLVTVNNKLAGLYPLFNLTANVPTPVPNTSGSFTLSNAKLTLTSTAAGLLNTAFNTKGFAAGASVGIAKITGQAAPFTRPQ